MKRVVDYFSLKEVTCLGHSLGAYASFYLAAIYPELVKKLIGLEIVTLGSVETHQIASWYREKFDQLLNIEKKLENQSPPSYSYTEAACRMKYNRWNSELTDEACSILLKRSLISKDSGFYFSTDQRCKMNDWPVLNCDQQISVFKQIKCPILLVLADNTERNSWAKNPIFQPVYNYFKTEALNTSVIVVSGNHDVHLNHPERVSPYVRSFLSNT
nr:PREDICTED: serine hydrolase-like protein [Bemisia tabaci]